MDENEMDESEKTIVTLGRNTGLKKLAFFLARESIAIQRAESPEAAVSLCGQEGCDAAILCWPLPDVRLERLVDDLRGARDGEAGRVVIVLAEPEGMVEAAAVAGDGVFVLPSERGALRLEESLAGLLTASARRAVRMLVKLSVEVDDNRLHRACQTVNLSQSGMALRTRERLEPGSRIAFSFFLPEDDKRIEGEAEIVRQIDKEVEGFEGLGVRFLTFRADSGERLEEFLAAHAAAQQAEAESAAAERYPLRAAGS